MPEGDFALLVDEFARDYLARNPTSATALGIHDFDGDLEEITPQAIEDEVQSLRGWLERLDHLQDSDCSNSLRIDREVLGRHLAGELHELETIRTWERDPNYYNDLASSAVYALLVRDFSPLDERLENVAARCQRIPALFAEARENLKRAARRAGADARSGVPRIFVEIALEEFAGARSFFAEVVPPYARESKSVSLRDSVIAANRLAVAAYDEFLGFLGSELLASAQGDFALGEDRFEAKLRFDEWVETPVGDILERGVAELRRTQEAIRDLAQRLEPQADFRETLRRYSAEHPSATDLVESYRRKCEDVRRFVVEHDLVSVPEGELRVVDTPTFLRSLLFAALDTPGPFESASLPSFFYVTPAESGWEAAEQEEYLRSHSNFSIESTTVHETYPGHFVQQLHVARCPSKLRKIFGGGTFIEGWAHYCEQMMVDEGYGAADPRIRLFQLHEAVWRIGRLIVATRMHCEGLTREAAEEFMVRETYQEKANAAREVKRYTRDPLVLMYSWGKWQIQELREAYRARNPGNFSLREFHDRLLSHGEPPVAALRSLVLD